MKTHRDNQKTLRFAALVAAALVATTSLSRAGVNGRIMKRGGGRPITGNITWYAASQEYAVDTGVTSLRIALRDVMSVQVAQPPALEGAVKMVKTGQYAGAVPALTKVVKDYEMLRWDVVAARWLAEAYLNLGQARKAIEMCEKVIRGNPDAATSGELSRIYWNALEKDGRTAKLTLVLGDAVKSGSREVAAVAQIKRADMARSKKEIKKALVDGYLRTAILFGDIQSVQPEALMKAAECFQELGQTAHAEKMRKRLLDNYPRSPEAQKVRAGA